MKIANMSVSCRRDFRPKTDRTYGGNMGFSNVIFDRSIQYL